MTEDPPRFVHIRGANSILPMARMIAEQYMAEFPEVTVAVSGGGGLHGFQSVMDGTAEVAMLAEGLPAAASRAPFRGIQLVQTPFASDAVAAIVHAANPLMGLDRPRMADVFAGRLRNWSQLGGADAPIRLFALLPFEPANESWDANVMGADEVLDRSATFVTTAEMIRSVAADPRAIGYIRVSAITRAVRPLALNGVAVTPETIRNGRYPVRRTLSLLHTTRAGDEAVAFVRYFTDPSRGLRHVSVINAVALGG